METVISICSLIGIAIIYGWIGITLWQAYHFEISAWDYSLGAIILTELCLVLLFLISIGSLLVSQYAASVFHLILVGLVTYKLLQKNYLLVSKDEVLAEKQETAMLMLGRINLVLISLGFVIFFIN